MGFGDFPPGFDGHYCASGKGLINCIVPCDHIPIRSWPLFRAKAYLQEHYQNAKQETIV